MSPRILPDIRVEVGTIYEACRVFGEERTGIEIPVTEPFVEKACGVFVNPIALRAVVANVATACLCPCAPEYSKNNLPASTPAHAGGFRLRRKTTTLPNGMAISKAPDWEQPPKRLCSG